MNIEFTNSICIPEGFAKEDFEYLRRQILTRRSVLSDQQKSTNLISHLFEAAKSMLTAMEMLGSADMSRAITKITKIHIEVETPKETSIDSPIRPRAVVIADGNLSKRAIDVIEAYNEKVSKGNEIPIDNYYLRFLGVYNIKPIKEFTIRVYLCEKNSDEQLLLGQDHRIGNPNLVLAYQENFPAPSVYRALFRDEIILPGIREFVNQVETMQKSSQ